MNGFILSNIFRRRDFRHFRYQLMSQVLFLVSSFCTLKPIQDFLRGYGKAQWHNMSMRLLYEAARDDIIRKTQWRCYALHFVRGNTTYLDPRDCEEIEEIAEAARQNFPE